MLASQPIYAAAQVSGPYRLTDVVLIGYAYPPPSVVAFLPFASYPVGLALFLTVNLGLLFTAVWAIVSRAWPAYRLPIFAVVLAVLARNAAFIDGVLAANVNVGLAGVIGWVALGSTSRIAGVVGGVAALVKVFPGVVALSERRKLRGALVATGVVAIISIATLPFVGVGSWLDFARSLLNARPDCSAHGQSIACTLRRCYRYRCRRCLDSWLARSPPPRCSSFAIRWHWRPSLSS
jgi:hypothetical protein